MAGRGPKPKPESQRRRKVKAERGEWTASPGVGWQHGDIPEAPSGLMPASVEAWDVWFKSWFAAHWTPDLLPGLRHVVRLYDQIERGEFQRSSELRLQMDTYGMTPKGQQDRRWQPPKVDEEPVQATGTDGATVRWGDLKVVDGG